MTLLAIRPEQFETLNDQPRRMLADDLERFLVEHDARARSAPDLREFVEAQIAQAEVDGMVTRRQFATYVTAAWLLGPDYPLQWERRRGGALWPHRSAAEKTEELTALIKCLTGGAGR